jgi:hypothetical protein
MATEVYKSATVHLIDGTELYITPLKIKYLREVMDTFEAVKRSKNDNEAISWLSECTRIAMKQYYPKIKTIEDLEDSVDIETLYRILDIAAGIKIDQEKTEETVQEQAAESGPGWEKFDLAKLESEVFLLGIWKDYEELEASLSMPELSAILESKRDLDYKEKRFLASIQGVDLDEQTGNNEPNAWEKMKAKVFSNGKTENPNDVVSLQGQNAVKAGFGIGMGLDYEDLG